MRMCEDAPAWVRTSPHVYDARACMYALDRAGVGTNAARQAWRKAIKNDVKPPNNSFAQNDVGGGKCIYDVAMNYRKML